MKKRSPILVLILFCITFGIYPIIYFYKTKEEMNTLGAGILTMWIWLVPFASIYWMWKWCCGVEKVTNNAMGGALAFVLLLALGPIGLVIIQGKLNAVATA